MSTATTPDPQYWVIVGSKENYDISKERGFTLQGIKARYRKKAEQINPGDKMIYYLTGLMVLAGIVTVKSHYVEDFEPIWPCSNKNEIYPYRFKIEPYLIPQDDSGFLKVAPFHDELTYLKKWPEKNWTLGFQGNIHQWPEADYKLVEAMFEKTTSPVTTG
ncbi:MAG: EVE domain-containing protein [Vampirovibrio sp.]|nr:EVE domain-containing protein [Vampirovibrio sp.]